MTLSKLASALPVRVTEGGTPVWLVELADVVSTLKALREAGFSLIDLTAVDYPSRAPRFTLVYVLYSYTTHERVILKADANESAPTVTGLWSGAGFLEREVYDMFGVRFDGHDGLSRILLWEGFEGHPLRKDYPHRARPPLPDNV